MFSEEMLLELIKQALPIKTTITITRLKDGRIAIVFGEPETGDKATQKRADSTT